MKIPDSATVNQKLPADTVVLVDRPPSVKFHHVGNSSVYAPVHHTHSTLVVPEEKECVDLVSLQTDPKPTIINI